MKTAPPNYTLPAPGISAGGTRLPDDVSRCHDDACILREHCRRFLQREARGTNVVHSMTLREPNSLTCTRQLPI